MILPIAGIDTMELVTQELLDRAHTLLGTMPKFWGRYFLGDDAEYIHTKEDSVLRKNNIRLVPICRETRRIAGTYNDGLDIGRNVAQDILDTFGETYLASENIEPYIFLDTEPDPEPCLSPEYYLGWSKGVNLVSDKVKFRPAVYANGGDVNTFNNLTKAIEVHNAECYGLWIARYYNNPMISEWDDNCFLTAKSCLATPVLIHQYIGDVDNSIYDMNKLNPLYPDTINHFISTPLTIS